MLSYSHPSFDTNSKVQDILEHLKDHATGLYNFKPFHYKSCSIQTNHLFGDLQVYSNPVFSIY